MAAKEVKQLPSNSRNFWQQRLCHSERKLHFPSFPSIFPHLTPEYVPEHIESFRFEATVPASAPVRKGALALGFALGPGESSETA